jgi:multidrug efflux pump subunit AcrA (membrane-fusion protein)
MGRLPLVEGMFCKVRIPGRVAENVVKLPAECVGFDRDASGFRSVYVAAPAEGGALRLKTVKVKESHMEGQDMYISEGLNPGDLVITTRLVNPLENSLVEPSNFEHQGANS